MDKTKTGYQIYGGTKRLALTYRGTGAFYIVTKTDLIEKLPSKEFYRYLRVLRRDRGGEAPRHAQTTLLAF